MEDKICTSKSKIEFLTRAWWSLHISRKALKSGVRHLGTYILRGLEIRDKEDYIVTKNIICCFNLMTLFPPLNTRIFSTPPLNFLTALAAVIKFGSVLLLLIVSQDMMSRLFMPHLICVSNFSKVNFFQNKTLNKID